jgi:DnaJ-class molecular chaperone
MSTGPAPDDPYALLGVARDASPDDLKRAFRTRARELHPDTGGDAEAFRKLVEAYDLLRDPASRARHDRRGQARAGAGPFWGSHWNPGGVNRNAGSAPPPPAAQDLDLEDIFADFSGSGGPDFGFGRRPGGGSASAQASPPPRRGSAEGGQGPTPRTPGAVPPPGMPREGGRGPSSGDARGPDPAADPSGSARGPDVGPPGADVHVAVDVPADVAVTGGTVTVAYRRLRRALDGRNVTRTDEIHDLRVPPGTTDGELLRVPKLGNASLGVGAVGDLVARVSLVEARTPGRMKLPPRPPPATERGAPPASGPTRHVPPVHPAPSGTAGFTGRTLGATPAARPLPTQGGSAAGSAEAPTREELVVVDVPVADALLGGRVQLDTASGAVQIAVPACSSSGTRLRVRGRGTGGGDVIVELRIVVPRELTPESRALIERFGRIHGQGR